MTTPASPSTPAYAHGASDMPLLGETIGENLRRTVERVPEREALAVPHQGYRATYREFWAQTGLVARGLLTRGVRRGDRVGIWAPNRYEWVLVQYATARIGAVMVNINPAYKTAELEYALNQSGASFLILARAFRTSDYVAMLGEVRGRCPELREALILEEGWSRLLADAEGTPEAELERLAPELQFDDPINIQYTSGTTGFPKGATLSHHNILNNGYFIGEGMLYTEADRVCIPVPFYHCFGMVLGNLACTSHGAAMVVPAESYDPERTMSAIAEERCTALYGTPTMFIGELDHPRFQEFDFSTLRTGIMAGAPCPIEVMKKVKDQMHMPDIVIMYGMTETSPVSTQSHIGDPLEKQVGTVGRVYPHVEIKVVDSDSGFVVGRGQTGELCTRGYSVMLGYWNNEAATRQAIDAGRWMHTGDLAVMDEDGYVKIVGRIKDMVIRGGENIYPREIEEFLYGHPDISDVQVVGVPSERYGEEVMAWVKLREGARLSGDDLAAYCRGRISTFKIPRYWKFVDSYPMTVTGKVQKFKMRETAVAELGLEKAAGVRTA
ncbi:MAG: AMP-binding protein [Candidatus Dormibacteraeota bacterium]|nr:AMP-binding protein [Candidatus Dormibacteraeota bacterium]